jgi:hypothetical protein
MFKKITAIIFGMIVLILFCIEANIFLRARRYAHEGYCKEVVRMIAAAKYQWAEANKATNGQVVTWGDIRTYLPSESPQGGNRCQCPDGGVYTINPIGLDPECSIPKHRQRWLDYLNQYRSKESVHPLHAGDANTKPGDPTGQ